jgi:hypothetical protein
VELISLGKDLLPVRENQFAIAFDIVPAAFQPLPATVSSSLTLILASCCRISATSFYLQLP